MKTSIQFGDCPACHVWGRRRVLGSKFPAQVSGHRDSHLEGFESSPRAAAVRGLLRTQHHGTLATERCVQIRCDISWNHGLVEDLIRGHRLGHSNCGIAWRVWGQLSQWQIRFCRLSVGKVCWSSKHTLTVLEPLYLALFSYYLDMHLREFLLRFLGYALSIIPSRAFMGCYPFRVTSLGVLCVCMCRLMWQTQSRNLAFVGSNVGMVK